MPQRRQETEPVEIASVFARMQDENNVRITAMSAEVLQRSAAIQRLEEITRQVENPYIGSFLSI